MKLNFFRESLRSMSTSGTLARSSSFLGREMASHIHTATDRVVVELGAGDGALTEHILARLHPQALLIAFEINPIFAEQLLFRFGKDSRFQLVTESAEHIKIQLQQRGFLHADCIISAIPFVVLPDVLTDAILKACLNVLLPGGRFLQFHYSLLFRDKYRLLFKKVHVRFVPINFPPAFVFACFK